MNRLAPLVIESLSPTKSATRTRSSRRRGLDGKVGVVDRGKTFRVGAGRQKSSNLGLGRLHATRQDQSGIPQVNEGDGATFRNAPTVPKLSRKARLSTIRNLCRHDSSHICIVDKLVLQGEGRGLGRGRWDKSLFRGPNDGEPACRRGTGTHEIANRLFASKCHLTWDVIVRL